MSGRGRVVVTMPEPFFSIIQRVGRALRARRDLGGRLAVIMVTQCASAVMIQRAYRLRLSRMAGVAERRDAVQFRAAVTIQKLWRGGAGRQRVAGMITNSAWAELERLRADQMREQRVQALEDAMRAAMVSRQSAYHERRRRERVLTTLEAVLIQRAGRAFRARRLILRIMCSAEGLMVDQRHRRLAWLQTLASYADQRRRAAMLNRPVLGGSSSPFPQDDSMLLAGSSFIDERADGRREGLATGGSSVMGGRSRIALLIQNRQHRRAGSSQGGRRVPNVYLPLSLRPSASAVEEAKEALAEGMRQRSAAKIQARFRESQAAHRRMVGLEGFAYLELVNAKATLIQRWYRSVLERRRTFSKHALPRSDKAVLATHRRLQRVEARAVREVQRGALVAAWRLATSPTTLDPHGTAAPTAAAAAAEGGGNGKRPPSSSLVKGSTRGPSAGDGKRSGLAAPPTAGARQQQASRLPPVRATKGHSPMPLLSPQCINE